jgi:hypothetical protein
MNRWVHLGRLLNFLKQYRRLMLLWTEQNRPDMLAMDKWWVITFSMSLAIDSINIMFVVLQSRSLLITQ